LELVHHSAIRRATVTPMATFRDRELSVDLDQQAVTKDGKPVRLLFWEYGVLAALVSRRGEVISSLELFDAGWGTTGKQMTKRVMYAVLRLQFKLGWGGHAWEGFPIEEVNGVGYRYRLPTG